MSLVSLYSLTADEVGDPEKVERLLADLDRETETARRNGFVPQIQLHALGTRLVATVGALKVNPVTGAVVPVSRSEYFEGHGIDTRPARPYRG